MQFESFQFGIALLIAAGLMNGAFLVPLKYTHRWRWENSWLVYSLVGMLAIPWITAWVTIPNLADVYRSSGTVSLLVAMVCGIGWGVGSLLYGIAANMVGMAVTYAVVLGLTSAVGSLVPLLAQHADKIGSRGGQAVLTGVGLSVVGIIVCAIAGGLSSEKSDEESRKTGTRSAKYALGVLACVASGFLSPLINVSFAFGGGIMSSAVSHGATPAFAANAVWPITLTAGCIVNAAYCVYLIRKAGAWSLFQRTNSRARNWIFAALAGVLWAGAYVFYGAGASRLGALAAAAGWPIATSVAIVGGNGSAVLTGEWKNKGWRASALMALGVAILVFAVYVIAVGSQRV